MSRRVSFRDFERMVLPGASAVQMPVLHPGERYAAYLRMQDDADVMDLRLLDRISGNDTLLLSGASVDAERGPMSLEEELARERARERCTGVGGVQWLPKSMTLFSVASRRLLLIDAESGRVSDYTHAAYITSAELNAGGDTVVFASGSNLWMIRIADGKFTQCEPLTRDGCAELLHGAPDQVSREEVFNGSAYTWLKAPRRAIAYASFDVTAVESTWISNGLQTRTELARYGRPGGNVSLFTVSVFDLETSTNRSLLPASAEWPYFAGLIARKSGDLVLMRTHRNQRAVQLLAIDVESGATRVILEQTGAPWVNIIDRPQFRPADDTLLWIHEPHGLGRIGMYDKEGRWLRDLGDDAGHVEGIVSLEPKGEGVYFLATGPDPRERHLFFASPATEWKSQRLTTEPGTHAGRLSPSGKVWCRVRDSLESPPSVRIEEADGAQSFQFQPARSRGIEPGFVTPSLVEALAADGTTPLYGALYEPKERASSPRPVVLLVYGGPHVQSVRKAWSLTADLRAQLLVQHGFVVLKCDNRGTSGRGIVFERPVYGNLGTLEVADQCAFLEQVLVQRPDLDRQRVGVCGWSYGGYLTLRCLQGRPELFAAGVAGAPVVRWEDYDAPYTERYMGSPIATPHFAADNAAGYAASSALSNIGAYSGRLLLIHGMNDENVLLRHSSLLVNDLMARGMLFETLFMPSERHSVRAPAQRRYLEQRVLGFLNSALSNPPQEPAS